MSQRDFETVFRPSGEVGDWEAFQAEEVARDCAMEYVLDGRL
jgi:hypothetical protein